MGMGLVSVVSPVALWIQVVGADLVSFGLRLQGFCSKLGIRVARLMKGVMIMISLSFARGSRMVY